jgi:hypothetical protein
MKKNILNKYIILVKNQTNEISIYSEIKIKEGDLYTLVNTLNYTHDIHNLRFYTYQLKYYNDNKENILNDLINN